MVKKASERFKSTIEDVFYDLLDKPGFTLFLEFSVKFNKVKSNEWKQTFIELAPNGQHPGVEPLPKTKNSVQVETLIGNEDIEEHEYFGVFDPKNKRDSYKRMPIESCGYGDECEECKNPIHPVAAVCNQIDGLRKEFTKVKLTNIQIKNKKGVVVKDHPLLKSVVIDKLPKNAVITEQYDLGSDDEW